MEKNESKSTRKDFSTLAAHDPHDSRHYGAVTYPIYQNSLFTFENVEQFEQGMSEGGYVYSRGNNPTVRQLEKLIARMEGGDDARCCGSGMAAISSAIMSVVRGGDHIICIHQAYGPARQFMGEYLQRFNISTTFVDGTSLEQIRSAVRSNTTLLYLESPSSLYFELQDLEACVQLAKSLEIKTIIDNTWATPIFQSPLEFGVDLVVHSISKYMGGHSDVVGGVVVGSEPLMKQINANEYPLFGGIMTSHIAALVLRGMRTLPIRMERHQQSALTIARHLESLPRVTKVNHPGLPSHPQHELAKKQMRGYSGLFSFETDIPYEAMRAWINSLTYFRIGVSWGGYEGLAIINRIMRNGEIVDGTTVRLQIGLEDPDALIVDLNQAFDVVMKQLG